MNHFNCTKRENIYVQPIENAPPLLVSGSLNADGENYYDFQKTITQPYTCVVSTSTGIVRYIDADPSTIAPHVGESVFGINEYPEGVTFDGVWRYDEGTGEFYQDGELVTAKVLAENAGLRAKCAVIATSAIATLQAGIDRGRSLDGDTDLMALWQDYLCDLRTMTPEDLQQLPAAFPAQPNSVI